MTRQTDCLQCQGEGGRWTPTWSPHLPRPDVKPVWSPCEYCGGSGVVHDSELGVAVHPRSQREQLVADIADAGLRLEPVDASEVAGLEALGLPADYREFVTQVGVLKGSDTHDMLTPAEVREAVERQHEFYEGATFGDDDEDQLALEAEAAFRRRLVPFQYAGTRGDFYCYLLSDGRSPIILDVYHDDYELAGAEFDKEPTPYTTDIVEHLVWVLGVIAGDDRGYPPAG